MKKNQSDEQLAFKLQKDTEKIEKDYQAKRRRQKKEKKEKEELSQQWLAPVLLFVSIIIGYLLYTFF
ncbi:MAG: hypothetical protein GX559_02705 [Candidatus Pacebacteria bacterium]|mgnify:CR=1 FL=1|nr:hypothetical protein [Candidatus Paceibacterota bacterium]